MASFFSKLFGRSGSTETESHVASGKTEAYAECTIRATPMREGAQFRLAGSIEKSIGEGGVRVRSFIRADLFTSEQDAIDATFRKGRQIIDQTGPSLFSDDAQSRQV
ncbi:HlyU family transcriptional regulator [Ensifer sp.]|uniref:HlyU family transcriptional regulator n=1 Tax=Ensifer sp. TaxID=1872086 RepID=UPI000DDA5060|nr:HlyU family transcriptional regulator [Ensifer sp.]